MRRGQAMLGGLSAMLLTTGCDLQRRPELSGVESAEELPILASYAGAYSNLKREARISIYDQSMLDQLPVQTRPVDFSREMVLFAALGPTPSPDYCILIERVERRGRRVYARVVRSYPSPGHGLAPGSASPYCAVIVPRSDFVVSGFDGRWPPDALSSVPVSRR